MDAGDREVDDDGWSAPAAARRSWPVLEAVHAVTYFAPESRAAYDGLGLRGFWMGYFAGRSAPFGAASPELVVATFFNFRPSLVHRALPDAWSFASPAAVLDARLGAAVTALRRLLGPAADGADVAEAADLAEQAAAACEPDGRPLFAALSSVARPAEPLARLWHAASLLREHRGDGHVAANLAHGIDGLGSHVLASAVDGIPRELLQKARAWTDDEWDAAASRFVDRGWLAPDGSATAEGTAVRRAVEDLTDDLAATPWAVLGPERSARLDALVRPLARAVAASGGLPSVNPIGVPLVR